MIVDQFNTASGEIHVNLHSQHHDFGIFQQIFGREMAEIDNYSKLQKQVRNVGIKYGLICPFLPHPFEKSMDETGCHRTGVLVEWCWFLNK